MSLRKSIDRIYHRILVFLHLSPLSLAEKVRLRFGAAVVLILALALFIPYGWMSQLTRQMPLEAGRAKAELLVRNHFRPDPVDAAGLPQLDAAGKVADPNERQVWWIRYRREGGNLGSLSEQQREMVESLWDETDVIDDMDFEQTDDALYSNYVRVFRATDNCLGCHNTQGSARAFSHNEPVGAIVIQSPARALGKTVLLNRVWIIVAGLIGGTGAIVAFYWITQRVILRPIRQLRALANNVAEGNLDIRSSIETRDEYQKLAEAFNHMLDSLQATQEKLRQANRQLDDKIVELSERNIELFKANKVKSEFLGNISHEFRTPLNSILGFAQVLRDKPESLRKEKGQRYAQNIMNGGQRLLTMINDLLHLAKTEAGKIQLHVEQVDIGEICRDVVASFSEITRRKRIKVKLTVDAAIPQLSTDGGKVQQILDNFVSNAVKFTPERGRIEIRASMPTDKTVRLSVSDTGCGIAGADQEKIFEKFRQADGTLTRRSAGSGLGLAICKELADMLAGDIGLESRAGEGSTFWLDIPVTLTREAPEAEHAGTGGGQ